MKTIELANSDKVAYVDDADYALVRHYKWWLSSNVGKSDYAYTTIEKKWASMHRLLIKPGPGKQVDHINRKGLDNRRINLRECNQTQNNANQRLPKGKSIFRGVCWHKEHKKWRAQLKIHGKKKHLGYFQDEISAAKAYDVGANEYFGEFARLNFPGRKEDGLTLLL